VSAARRVTMMLCALAACGCARALPEERFVSPGRMLGLTIRCPGGGYPNAEIALARFDAARPGLKGAGYPRARVVREIEEHGGAIANYAGRRFRSPYLHTHNWLELEEPITAEAIMPALSPQTVYVEMPVWRPGKRVDGIFYPWSAPPGKPICTGAAT
jgi:hypothetical protein